MENYSKKGFGDVLLMQGFCGVGSLSRIKQRLFGL